MSVTPDQPYGVPADPVQFVLSIRATDATTPQQVMVATHHALMEYGRAHRGTTTPFNQQPGFPQGQVWDSFGTVVGHWEVKGLTS